MCNIIKTIGYCSHCEDVRAFLQRHEGQRAPQGVAAIEWGKPLKVVNKPQGRYQHEIRLDGLKRNKTSGS
jgi:hypothetical protein